MSSTDLVRLRQQLRQNLRQFPDFPQPGILFEDIFPLFRDPQLLAQLIDALVLFLAPENGGPGVPDLICGLEARGFLFGPPVALRLGVGFIPVRKPGKLPGAVERASFGKEYGQDHFEIQKDAVRPGQKVLVLDDIIATGGSAAAAGTLIERLGGTVMGYVFLMELTFLHGRDKLNAPVYTLLASQEASKDAA